MTWPISEQTVVVTGAARGFGAAIAAALGVQKSRQLSHKRQKKPLLG
jgi:NAD(P)-dependent dehydrogenase (short-subunit alcohol dehydrogenase family)